MELRPYQKQAVAQLRNRKRPLLVAPTGAGKTHIAAEVIRREENSHVVIFAHRRELIHQARNRLNDLDIPAGLILAGEPKDNMRRVQIASIQTLAARCLRGDEELPPAQIVIVDEGHHCPANTYRELISRYPDAQIIGMTATPCRRDGRGLGSLFDCLVETPQIPELIKLGYLVGTKVYAPSTPDLKGVRTQAGDYVESQLAERMDKVKLVGDIVTHWHRLADGRKTVVFASSVGHSVHIRDEFRKSGVRAEHIDGKISKDERDEILGRLAAGNIDVVTNCMVLTEGWDMPDVGCCVLARPTKSMGLYRQMAGRVIRPAPGKDHALILDHAGATFQHGFIEDEVVWTLDPDERAVNQTATNSNAERNSRLVECSNCQAIRTAGQPCGHCGFMPKPRPTHLSVIDGDLQHLDRNGLHPNHLSIEQKKDFYLGLLHLTLARGNQPGAAAYRYKDRFNEWPPRSWAVMTPIPPTAEVAAWDRHCRIKYAKAMQKAQAHG